MRESLYPSWRKGDFPTTEDNKGHADESKREGPDGIKRRKLSSARYPVKIVT